MEPLHNLGHIGIIPDGNRRWANKNGQNLETAYRIAMQKLVMVIETLMELRASSTSIYLLSRDNIERSRDDLDAVLNAELWFLEELLPALKERCHFKAFHAGNPELLPPDYVHALNNVVEPDASNRRIVPSLFLCAAYDPLDEALDCLGKNRPKQNGGLLIDTLWVPHAIDLVIRTGGDQRMSGFLPLQCRYAEFFFEPYFFPDINRERVNAIVQGFCFRKRRFGK